MPRVPRIPKVPTSLGALGTLQGDGAIDWKNDVNVGGWRTRPENMGPGTDLLADWLGWMADWLASWLAVQLNGRRNLDTTS